MALALQEPAVDEDREARRAMSTAQAPARNSLERAGSRSAFSWAGGPDELAGFEKLMKSKRETAIRMMMDRTVVSIGFAFQLVGWPDADAQKN